MSLNLLIDWSRYIPCNENYVVPLDCRPEFKDYTTFDMATRLGRLTADPIDYTNLEGGIYYRTTNQRLYYRNATVWVPIGNGDGDVIFDPVGTAQQDNGVARWSITSKYIQGSVSTLSDAGLYDTPGGYRTTNSTPTNQAFVSRLAVGSDDFVINQDGTITWGGDISLQRTTTQTLTITGTDAVLRLPGTGNSTVTARKILSGQGGNSSGYTFRCPAYTNTFSYFSTPIINSTIPLGTPYSIQGYTLNIPANTFKNDNEYIEFKFMFATGSTGMVKRFRATFFGSDKLGTIAGGVQTGIMIITIFRQSSNQALFNMTGTYEGNVLGSASATAFAGAVDWTAAINVPLYLEIVGDGSTNPVPANEMTVNGGWAISYCR